jgi:subtilisin family serine protease
VAAAQERVLTELQGTGFRLKRRYRSLNGFSGWAPRAAIEALSHHPEVESIYLDRAVHATLIQGRSLIGANPVHSAGFTGLGVKVAVLDTGIDTNHPDLQDDLVAQHCFCDDHPAPNRACCPGGGAESTSAEDDEGHGTSVSGIVTSGGVAAPLGVAPDAGIVAVKVLSSTGGGTFSDIAAGLDWVLTERAIPGSPVEGVAVVNMSLGDGGQYNNAAASPCTGTNTAIAVQALHAAGVAVFASSGNDGHDAGIAFPACVAQAISVGGVYDAALGSISWCGNATCTTILCTDNPTAADVFVCHSNSGSLLDVLAPDWQTRTSALGGGVTSFGGTSASSPYAAAEAALLFDADATLTPEQVRTLLKTHGPLVTNPDNGMSFVRSDIGAAIASLQSGSGATQVVLTQPGADFAVSGSTTLTVQVQDAGGNLVTSDSSTQITFAPTGSARITAVNAGSGDGSYGVPGGAETVTVAGGVATITLQDLVIETFQVAFSNDAGLTNPPNDSIQVTLGAATQVVLTQPGADFAVGGSTALGVQVQDAGGNLVTADGSTQITFAPSGSARITAVNAGTGDGAYGVSGGAETVTVAGGVAAITLQDLVIETFQVAFSNNAGLANPPSDSIQVTLGAATRVVLTQPGADFAVGGSTAVGVQVQDAGGNLVTADGSTQITFEPSGSARITGVNAGTGDGSYGVSGGAETVTVAGGVAAITLDDLVAETFQVAFSNDAGLTDPPSDSIEVSEPEPPPIPVPASTPFGVALLVGMLLATALAVERSRRSVRANR